ESSEEDNWEDNWIENPNSINLGAGEAWWNLNSDDDYVEEIDYNWNQEEEFSSENEGWIDERNTEEELLTLQTLMLFGTRKSNSGKSDPVIKYNVDDLPENKKDQVLSILDRNASLFARNLSELGRTNRYKHRIITGDALPIKQRPYRHSLLERKFLTDEIK
ncbi:7018_t:CDS:2, partial [Gigaspora rosea]